MLHWAGVADWYDGDYYERLPAHNPLGPEEGDDKVLRGGSWYNLPGYVRSAYRYRYLHDYGYIYIGFRCARGSD